MQQNLSIYENQYGKNHLKTTGVLRDLGRVYLLEGDIQTAENLLNTTFGIFKENDHPENYTCLETLADLYQKKHDQARARKIPHEIQHFHDQTLQALNHALEIVSNHFPEGSPHRVRIQKKIEKVAQEYSNERFPLSDLQKLPVDTDSYTKGAL